MERPLTSPRLTEPGKAANPDQATAANEEIPGEVWQRVALYWTDGLGLSDHELVAALTHECIQRAKRRVGGRSNFELLLRSLEEAQRRFDLALARSLKLPGSRDSAPLAAARAAFLLTAERKSAEALFQPQDVSGSQSAELQSRLPSPTPPEAHLTMQEQPLRFWLFRSTHAEH